MKLAKFINKLYNNNLSIVLQNRFTKIAKTHTYATIEGQTSQVIFLSRVNKTAGQNKLEYREVKLLNQISEKLKCKHFNLFKNPYRKSLFSVHSLK